MYPSTLRSVRVCSTWERKGRGGEREGGEVSIDLVPLKIWREGRRGGGGEGRRCTYLIALDDVALV